MNTKNILNVFALIALAPVFASAQTATPSTTLCGAVTATATSVCLASTTNVVNQTGLYVDQEYMTVTLANGQTLASSNAVVPVTRGNRFAGSGPTSHASGALVWEALTPDKSVVPGSNGFIVGTTMRDAGSCVRGNETYLPHIFPDLAAMRDCQNSVWTDYNAGLASKPTSTPLSLISASGALGVGSGKYVITKSSAAAALTLAAPTAGVQDGTVIVITSATAQAHTITATGLFEDGSTTTDVATFAAHAGASLTIMAYNGKWVVLSANAITFT